MKGDATECKDILSIALDISELQNMYFNVYVTKLSGLVMKTLLKDVADNTKRDPLRAEIAQAVKDLGETFTYEEHLPAAIVDKMTGVIDGKKARRG